MRIALPTATARAAALAAAVLLSLTACASDQTPKPTATPAPTPTATPPPEPIDLVPTDANLLANVDLGRILLDPDLAQVFESVPFGRYGPGSLDDALAEVEAETGINLLQFSRIVVFGAFDLTGPDDQGVGASGDFSILARGTFGGDAILERIRLNSDGEFRKDEYRGHALLIEAEEGRSEITMTVLADGIFVAGPVGAVISVIDVLEVGGGALSGPLLDTYVALGDPLMKAAVAVPREAFDDLPAKVGPIPLERLRLSDIRIVGFVGDKEANLVTATVTLEYTTAASATVASDWFHALSTLAGSLIPPGAAVDLIDLIDVSLVEATVRISFSATVDQLTDAIEEFGELGPSFILG